MDSNSALAEGAQRGEIDESTQRSETLRNPAAIEAFEGKGDLERQIRTPGLETSKSTMFSERDFANNAINPKSWSTRKKVFHTAIPALYGFVM